MVDAWHWHAKRKAAASVSKGFERFDGIAVVHYHGVQFDSIRMRIVTYETYYIENHLKFIDIYWIFHDLSY